MPLRLTYHAQCRAQQRGWRSGDVSFVMAHGTEIPDGYMLTRRDAMELERQVKLSLEQARRLVGKRIVCNGETVVTLMQVSRKTERASLAKVK